MKKLLSLLFILSLIFHGNGQDLNALKKEGNESYQSAQQLYAEERFPEALTKINQAIENLEKVYGKGQIVEEIYNLRAKIKVKIDERERIRELEANKETAREFMSDARLNYSNKNYQQALYYIERALDYDPKNSEAFQLKELISASMLTNKAMEKLEEAQNLEKQNRKREALSAYKEAYRLNNDVVSRYKINDLEKELAQFDKLVQEGTRQFRAGNYASAIENYDLAAKIMKLDSNSESNYSDSKFNFHSERGTEAYRIGNYDRAKTEFETALKYASNSSMRDAAQKEISKSNYEFYIQEAKTLLNNGRLNEAQNRINSAKEFNNNQLESKDFELQNKLNFALEEYIYNSGDYKNYLLKYPNGKYAGEAKIKLVNESVLRGKRAFQIHDYDAAISNFEDAMNFSSSSDQRKLGFKISNVNFWKKIGGNEVSLDLGIAVPMGFNQTTITTTDNHGFQYLVQNDMGNSQLITDIGSGIQKLKKISAFTPLSLQLDFSIPLKIRGITPFELFASAYGFHIQGKKIADITPINYEISEGIHQPTGYSITSMDTLNTQLFENAYQFTRFGGNVGIRPIPFLGVYLPLHYIKVKSVLGAECIDCAEEQLNIGGFNTGIGVRLDYTIGNFLFMAKFENWGPVFKNSSSNVIFEPPVNVLNPKVKSYMIGAEVGVVMDSQFVLSLYYDHANIKGFFGYSLNSPTRLHQFAQHNLGLRLVYKFEL
jgi:tetratricopeptide (TPR) repeat protein